MYRVFSMWHRLQNFRILVYESFWVEKHYSNICPFVSAYMPRNTLLFQDTVPCCTVSVPVDHLHAYFCLWKTLLTRNCLLRGENWAYTRVEFVSNNNQCNISFNWYATLLPNPGVTNPGCQFARATKFYTVATNICGSSVWNLLYVTHLAPRI
jgi:hypothetical protein